MYISVILNRIKRFFVSFRKQKTDKAKRVDYLVAYAELRIEYLLMKHRLIRYVRLLFTSKVPSSDHLHKLTESFLDKLKTRQWQNLNQGD